jgi:serine/threonine protein kinase
MWGSNGDHAHREGRRVRVAIDEGRLMTHDSGPPDVFGHDQVVPEGYALHRRIGRGATSVVWEATGPEGEAVALKLLDADYSEPEARRRFERERGALVALGHLPGILEVRDAGVEGGRPWLAMELCRRGSLSAQIDRGGPLGAGTALSVMIRLACALETAHTQGIVHKDIKPANVMLTDRGEPVLGDFGIARVASGMATATTVSGFSPDHVAPELLGGSRSTPASDVYSLGTTVWELIDGTPPFRREGDDASVGATLLRAMTASLSPSPRVPEAVQALLEHMTAKDPQARPASMAEVVRLAHTAAHDAAIELVPDGVAPFAEVEPRDAAAADPSPTVQRPSRRHTDPDPVLALEVSPAVARGRRLLLVATLAAVTLLLTAGGIAVVAGFRPWEARAEPVVLAQPAPATTSTARAAPATSPAAATTPPVEQPAEPVPTTAPRDASAPQRQVTDAPTDPGRSAGITQTPEITAAVPAAPADKPVAQRSCVSTAISGGLTLGAEQQHNAGGPNFTSSACTVIEIKLTGATYRTYARACLEVPDGSSITRCGGWLLLSYPNTWDTLMTGVPAGSRWQLQMYSLGAERADFLYTA